MQKRPRSLSYFRLRLCERLHLTEAEFHAADYQTQLHWLSYEYVRQLEEQNSLFQHEARHE